ncbi:hypothetical protein NDN08_003172 [Rhodosorus marinus]|uniref:ARID domain-containing protein n=1 Tax=Rhodosorus marinus TaxID=101924 RepID=A0AAV8V016_9RHOD|nr:hypothetical protein NDN08_003172 [Rhodosorus marinus]
MDAFGPDLLSTEPGESVQESEKDLRVDNEGVEDVIQKYKAVVPEIGRRFISEQMKNDSMESGSPKDDFLADHKHFMSEIGELNFKVPTLGGSPLNIYQLFVEVMDQGGLNNVIETRAFKIVTRKLVLPRSCTSAAYMLRQSYEKILYQYEQHFVFGRDPQRAKLLLMEKKKLIEAENQVKQEATRANEQQVDPGLVAQPSASEAAKEPSVALGRERPKRKAAETAVTAVAASVSIDTFGVNPSPQMPRRRGRPPSAEKLAARAAAAAAQEAAAAQAAAAAAAASGSIPNGGYAHGGAEGRDLYGANIEPPPQVVFNYDNPQEREKLVLSMAGDVREQVAWGLGALNSLSCDNRRNLLVRDFPGLIDALLLTLQRYWRDMERLRKQGLHPGIDARIKSGLRIMAAASATGRDTSKEPESWREDPTLLQYDNDLFNSRDPVSVETEERALLASNVLRNLSFIEKNGALFAESVNLHEMVGRLILCPKVALEIKDNLTDLWINSASHMNVSEGYPAEKVLVTAVSCLDPFLPGQEYFVSRFAKGADILARLATNIDRNEGAITACFDVLLPRLIDVLGGQQRRVAAAALSAVCNVSMFDWPARGKLARTPRGIDRLVALLQDEELGARAALTLQNLAEAPNNRSVLTRYERDLVELAVVPGPAAETIASVLYEFTAE